VANVDTLFGVLKVDIFNRPAVSFCKHIEHLYVCIINNLGDSPMAKNTGDGWRRGEVRDRSQVKNPRTDSWTKRGPNGQFMDGKATDFIPNILAELLAIH
jgi:hypothetical protein